MGIPPSRQQTLLLSKGLSFIPRAVMIDLVKFMQNVKIKCGKLTVKAHRHITGSKGTKHVPGTAQLSQHQWHKQTDWPSNRLMNCSMENTFYTIRQEFSNLVDTQFNNDNNSSVRHNFSRKEHNALKKFTKDHSLVFKKGDKTSCKQKGLCQRRNGPPLGCQDLQEVG